MYVYAYTCLAYIPQDGLKGIERRNRDVVVLKRDCTEWLERDPRMGGIGHKENGDHGQTQRVIYGQARFPKLIKDVTADITYQTRRTLCIFRCQSGYHRADTSSKTIKAVGNSLHHKGLRLLNVQVFSFADSYGKEGVAERLQSIEAWLKNPRCLIECQEGRQNKYAFDATSSSDQAGSNFDDIWNWVEENYEVSPTPTKNPYVTVPWSQQIKIEGDTDDDGGDGRQDDHHGENSYDHHANWEEEHSDDHHSKTTAATYLAQRAEWMGRRGSNVSGITRVDKSMNDGERHV